MSATASVSTRNVVIAVDASHVSIAQRSAFPPTSIVDGRGAVGFFLPLPSCFALEPL